MRDVAAVADALVSAHDHPQQAQAMGLHNRERIEHEASRRGQMDRMWQLYAQMIKPNLKGGKPGGAAPRPRP